MKIFHCVNYIIVQSNKQKEAALDLNSLAKETEQLARELLSRRCMNDTPCR